MNKAIILISSLVVISAIQVPQAKAQVKKGECFFNEGRFSTGARLRNGSKIIICSENGRWATQDDVELKIGAMCWYNGGNYTTGAIVSISQNRETFKTITCLNNGRWKLNEK